MRETSLGADVPVPSPLQTHSWLFSSHPGFPGISAEVLPPFQLLTIRKLRQAKESLLESCWSLKCLFGRVLCVLANLGLRSCSYSPVSVTLYFEPLIHQKGQEVFPLRREDFWNSRAGMFSFLPSPATITVLHWVQNSASCVCCLMLIQRVSFAFYFLLLYLFQLIGITRTQ